MSIRKLVGAAALWIAAGTVLSTVIRGQTEQPPSVVLAQDAKPADAEAGKATAARAAKEPATPGNSNRVAGEKALARLQELGASVQRGRGEGGKWITVEFLRPWKGSNADLDLLNEVAELGNMSLTIDFRRVSPRYFVDLKLQRPLTTLRLEGADDQALEPLAALPASGELVFSEWYLTPVGCRHFVEIAADVESLEIEPVH